jgi:hypothetical protein
LLAAFRSALAHAHPDIRITVLDRPPVMGALALANRLFVNPTPSAPLTGTFSPEVTS